MIAAKPMRSTVAAMMPMRIARLRCSFGRPAAASPMTAPVSPLRQRLIDDMHVRRFSRETQRNDIRDVGRFATFLGRPPDTATAEDLRRFQVEQRDAGLTAPTMNSIVAALRFFFTHTLPLLRRAHGHH